MAGEQNTLSAGRMGWVCVLTTLWASGCGGNSGGSAASQSGHAKPPFEISQETTYVTGPRFPDGYVDFDQAIDEALKQGVTNDTNAAAAFLELYGEEILEKLILIDDARRQLGIQPASDDSRFIPWTTFRFWNDEGELIEHSAFEYSILRNSDPEFNDLPSLLYDPWFAEDYPRLDAWLKRNESALEIVRHASRRPDFFWPARKNVYRKQSAAGDVVHGLDHALRLRAMQRVAQGEWMPALDDLLTGIHLVTHMATGEVPSDFMNAVDRRQRARWTSLHWVHHVTDQVQLARGKALWDDIPPLPFPRHKLLTARLLALKELQDIARNGSQGILRSWPGNWDSATKTHRWSSAGPFFDRIDWNEAFRQLNQRFDAWETGLDWSSHPGAYQFATAERKLLLALDATLESEVLHDTAKLSSPPPDFATRRIVDCICCNQFALINLPIWTRTDRQTHQLVSVAFALAMYRLEQGHFPEQLAELVPDHVKELPRDLFGGQPLHYERIGTGYRLYSVGFDGIDQTKSDLAPFVHEDDVGIEMPPPHPMQLLMSDAPYEDPRGDFDPQ